MRVGTSRGFTAAAAIAAVLAAAPAASGAAGDLDLVSRGGGLYGPAGDGDSRYSSVSASGRFVAFSSMARNLSRDDDDATWDVFVRDTLRGTTTLVSRASGPAGAGGDDDSMFPAISGDGTRVAFTSGADNLSPADDDTFANVFVRDLRTGVTTLVSRATGPVGEAAHDYSFSAAISADGRHVAFASYADLTPESGPHLDVFVRDTATASTVLVSRRDGPAGRGVRGDSEVPSISADGRRVAFFSTSRELTDDRLGIFGNVFVRDLRAGTTSLVSRAGIDGPGGDGVSRDPDISADGLRVAFSSDATDLSALDDDAVEDVFVRDLSAGATVLASRGSGRFGGPADGDSSAPRISADGRHVAFRTAAASIVDGDDDRVADVVVRHLGSLTTTLVSRAPGPRGAAADVDASDPDISADGRFVVFHSGATTLSAVDRRVDDVFRRDVPGRP